MTTHSSPRLAMLDPETAENPAGEAMRDMLRQMGAVPNLYRAMANSPAALLGFLGLRSALQGGKLDPVMRERVALLVAAANECSYCTSAHGMLARRAGLGRDEIFAAMRGQSPDPKVQAGLTFASEVVSKKGHVTDATMELARAEGWTTEELCELLAHVVLNIFSNYFDHLAHPVNDFPALE